MSRKRRIIRAAGLAFFVIALAITAVSAQQNSAKPAEPKYTEIKYSADTSSYRWEGKDRILALKGNVKFVQGDTVVIADKIDYREATKVGTATGNFKIYDNQHTITAEKGTVSFEEKKGSLIGSVRMIAKPRKTGEQKTRLESEWEDEVLLTCDKIDYFYKEKKAVVPGSVTMVQKERTVNADSATYFGREEVVHLTGNVTGKDGKDKHSFSAPKVVISLRENNEWIEAEKATGTFYVKDDDEEEPSPSPAENGPAPQE